MQHRLDVIVMGDMAELFVDGIRNARIQSALPQTNLTTSRHLVASRPIFIGGAPTELLTAAYASGLIRKADGIIGKLFPKLDVILTKPLVI